jgi:hypothetical protein
MAVAQVAAVAERQAEDGVARLKQSEEDGLVRLRPGVRLNVRVPAAEKLARARDGQRLDGVEVDGSGVPALAWVALDRSERDDRSQRLAPGAAHVVLRRDQLELIALALLLAGQGGVNLGVDRAEVAGEEVLRRRWS